MEILEREESVSVTDLVSLFEVSKVTVRNDLDDLEAKGLLVRTHGGAVLAERHELVRLVSETINENRDRKRRACELAARFVRAGHTIVIDSGSTTVHLAKLIADLPITVITNSVLVIDELKAADAVELIVAGGVLRRPSLSCIGAIARDCFALFHSDMLFMGAAGASLEAGITCTNLIEADAKRAMLRGAAKVCLIADSTKFGNVAMAHVCGWDSIDVLCSDAVDPVFRTELENLGVQVVTP